MIEMIGDLMSLTRAVPLVDLQPRRPLKQARDNITSDPGMARPWVVYPGYYLSRLRRESELLSQPRLHLRPLIIDDAEDD